jgi:hypothetical protein
MWLSWKLLALEPKTSIDTFKLSLKEVQQIQLTIPLHSPSYVTSVTVKSNHGSSNDIQNSVSSPTKQKVWSNNAKIISVITVIS